MDVYKKYVAKFKRLIAQEYDRKNFDKTLLLLKMAAEYMYQWNQEYADVDLERTIYNIAEKIIGDKKTNCNQKKLLIYDGFGTDRRGLMSIYLDAAIEKYDVVYVTRKEFSENILEFINKMNNSNATYVFLEQQGLINEIIELNDIICHFQPEKMILYTYPSDVVGICVFDSFESICERYLINLTDQAFWLGINAFDYCIEFRDYGAYITNTFRGVDKRKILKLPFYPVIKDYQFQDFPFAHSLENIVLFSGGALYKTMDVNDTFYHLVERLLLENEYLIFWYAGSGDKSKMQKLMNHYPNRVYLTEERRDLFQILKNCDFFLNTYPISGGLMVQYSAAAGVIPFTLKYDDECRGLINEKVEEYFLYDSCEQICKEFKRIANNQDARKELKQYLLEAVISKSDFDENFANLLENKYSNYIITYTPVDVEKYRCLYHKQNNFFTVCDMITKKNNLQVAYFFVIEFIVGIILKIKKRIV